MGHHNFSGQFGVLRIVTRGLRVTHHLATPPSNLFLWPYKPVPCVVMSVGKAFSPSNCVLSSVLSSSYDHEGRLTNVTRPTGVVTSLHREMEKSITIDIENSNRDDDVTVITNLSSVEASYTVVQGKPPTSHHPTPKFTS